jgi:deuterolysin
MQRTNLPAEAFVSIPAGTSYETTINAASLHDLSSGGTFSMVAEGSVPYALANSTELSGNAVSFKSNTLTVEVDGAAAAAVPRALNAIDKRSQLQSDCSSSQRSATTRALSNCASLARAASTAAKSGSASKFSEYFKTTATSTRTTVANRLTAVAGECSSSTSGATYYYCTDVYGYCESNVLAYTIPSTDEVVNCPLYYSALPALTSTCHAQDQATTTLHEMTHAPGVYSPGTQDLGYGYAAATALSSSSAVLNADSYALYANGKFDFVKVNS